MRAASGAPISSRPISAAPSTGMSDAGWSTYQLRRRTFTIGEDFWIQNERGENVFRVDQEMLHIRETFALHDANGNGLATVDRKILALQPTMNIERNGQVWATVRKALFTLFRQHFSNGIAIAPGQDQVLLLCAAASTSCRRRTGSTTNPDSPDYRCFSASRRSDSPDYPRFWGRRSRVAH